MYTQTLAVKKILDLKKRLRIVQGGSSAGKTIAIIMILIDYAGCHKNETISIVSEHLPHLKKGAIKDFLNIMKEHNYYDDSRWNRTDYIYTFETGSTIEFFGADSADKVRGPRRDVLFVNECNNISYETFRQLSMRTNKYIYLDFNPVESFWVHENVMLNLGLDYDFLVLTYKDNDALPEVIVKELEAQKDDVRFWKVYGEGQLGTKEGKIYDGWQLIDEIPHEARLISYGMDFGYKNDPTALIALYYLNGGYIVDEIAFSLGLFNKNIADMLLALPRAPVIADAAEPKSIDELRLYGITVIPSTKGKGAVSQRIGFVQQQRISVVKRAVNVIKAYRNYSYLIDKDGKVLNDPSHNFSDAMDAVGYALQIKATVEQVPDYIQPPAEITGLNSSGSESYEEQQVYTGDFIPKRR